MSRYSDAQRRRVRAAVFVAGLFGYAALAALVFPLDGSSDAFGRTLGIGVLGLLVLMASVAGITAWRVRAPGIFNASSSTLLWVGLSSGVVVAAALPDLQGLRKNNCCIRPRGSPAFVVARRSLAPGKLPPRA